MADQSKFWDRMSARYIADPIPDEASYQTKLEKTRTYFQPDMKVLEFGCGSGATALLHAPFVAQIDGIDFSEKMIAHAKTSAEQQGVTNARFETSSIEELNVAPESYDAVLAMSVLHLTKDLDAVLAKVFELLSPGGAFVSSTACLQDFVPVIKFIGPIGQAVGLLPNLNVFSQDALLEALQRAGFAIDQVWQPPKKSRAVFVVAKKAG